MLSDKFFSHTENFPWWPTTKKVTISNGEHEDGLEVRTNGRLKCILYMGIVAVTTAASGALVLLTFPLKVPFIFFGLFVGVMANCSTVSAASVVEQCAI